MDTREHRKFVYGMAREALKRNATDEQIQYALSLLDDIPSGHKALGFKTRLQAKADGSPIEWSR